MNKRDWNYLFSAFLCWVAVFSMIIAIESLHVIYWNKFAGTLFWWETMILSILWILFVWVVAVILEKNKIKSHERWEEKRNNLLKNKKRH